MQQNPPDTGSEWAVLAASLEHERAFLAFVCGRLPAHTWNAHLGDPRGSSTPLTLVADRILWEALMIDGGLQRRPLALDPSPHDITSMPDLMAMYNQRASETWEVLQRHQLDDPAEGQLPRDVVAPNLRAIVVKILTATASASAVLEFVQMAAAPFEP